MADTVLDRIEAAAETFREQGPLNERAGKLTEETASALRSAQAIRMLQPKSHGGLEVHPREFADTVMRIAALDGATGWVAGVVGVHPWELAFADAKVRDEIWGEDQDTWVASPYAPMGVARPVDGGYVFNGRWQFSSGTDHCRWIFLGGLLGDAEGNPTGESLHLILPRSDYEIVDGSWDVVGLRGTGSKDVVVRDAFVPEYRTLPVSKVESGEAAREAGVTNPTYHMPFSAAFPLGITASVIGICEGGLALHAAYQSKRVTVIGDEVKNDPHAMYALSEAAAEIAASRAALLDNACRMYDLAASGRKATFAERAAGRRTQVQAAWRAVRAFNEIFARSGGNGLRMDNPMQRFWRDANNGLVHAIHTPGGVFQGAALSQLGVDPPAGPMRMMI
ncbi:hypothetical protein [Streptomyces sulphureus]|uniref:hypothetical protein n=1 Tax=Streptomyces sulphureus TaxID=47758 RepID=UPI00035F72BE|nr:hypothetical protein [Streptomyces sulphureus]